jgi:hypothetical protein
MDTQHNHQSHETREAHTISHDLLHHNFAGAQHELNKEAHHPQEFKKLLHDINSDLKQHHQHPLSIHHDKHGHVSHIDFGKHDIYHGHGHKQGVGEHGVNHPAKVEHGHGDAPPAHKPAKPEASGEPTSKNPVSGAKPSEGMLDPQQRAELAKQGKIAPASEGMLDPQQRAELAKQGKVAPAGADAPPHKTINRADFLTPSQQEDLGSRITEPTAAKGVDAARPTVEKAPQAPRSPDDRESPEFSSARNADTLKRIDPSLRESGGALLGEIGKQDLASSAVLELNRQKLIDLASNPKESLGGKKAAIDELVKQFKTEN